VKKKDLIFRVAPKIIGKNFVPKNSPEITGFFVAEIRCDCPVALQGSKSSTRGATGTAATKGLILNLAGALR
jgi:hypothetical protein